MNTPFGKSFASNEARSETLRIFHHYIVIMRPDMNRNWFPTDLFSGRPIRIGFIASWIFALAIGCSVAHAFEHPTVESDLAETRFEFGDSAFGSVQRADLIGHMNEHETIANLNPKLGKILANLIRAQEEFPKDERGESDHAEKPPIGMKPVPDAVPEEGSTKGEEQSNDGGVETEASAGQHILAEA